MSLSDRYEEIVDDIYEDHDTNGKRYAIEDLMDYDRLIMQVYEGILAGELDAAVDRLRVAYQIITENVEALEDED